MPIGPSCCVADVTPNGARVFTNTQDAYGTRQNIKDVARRRDGLEVAAR